MIEGNRIAEVTHEVAKGARDVALFVVGGISTVIAWGLVRGEERKDHVPHPINPGHTERVELPVEISANAK